jgi:hypothetical protein
MESARGEPFRGRETLPSMPTVHACIWGAQWFHALFRTAGFQPLPTRGAGRGVPGMIHPVTLNEAGAGSTVEIVRGMLPTACDVWQRSVK